MFNKVAVIFCIIFSFVAMSSPKRWTYEEDIKLKNLVEECGKQDWARVARKFSNRNGKQCRERYINYVDPDLDSSPLCEEEMQYIIDQQLSIGNKWTAIADMMHAKFSIKRSPNVVKNFYYSTSRKEEIEETEAISTLLSLKRTQRDWDDGKETKRARRE